MMNRVFRGRLVYSLYSGCILGIHIFDGILVYFGLYFVMYFTVFFMCIYMYFVYLHGVFLGAERCILVYSSTSA